MFARFSSKAALAAAFAASCLVVAPAMAADAEPNPAFVSWSKCKPGATTTTKGTSEAMGQKSTQTIVTKLLDVQADKVTVETTMTMEVAGQKNAMPAQKTDIPKVLPAPKLPEGVKMPEVKKGEESVTVLGKSVTCQTAETNMEQNGMKVSTKVWTSNEIPGIVKMTATTSGGMQSTSTMELVEFKDGN